MSNTQNPTVTQIYPSEEKWKNRLRNLHVNKKAGVQLYELLI